MSAAVVSLVITAPHTHVYREALIPDQGSFIVARFCDECMGVDVRAATSRDLAVLPVIEATDEPAEQPARLAA